MSKERITIEVLASGQPRPYADSRYVCRITFEHVHPFLGGDLAPDYMDASTARAKLNRFGLLSIDFPDRGSRKHGLDSYLEYLKPIDPHIAINVMKYPYGDPNREVSYIWEFYTVQPYTD